MRIRDHTLHRCDPTGEVDLENPHAVATAIKSILDRLHGDAYDSALLAQGIDALVQAYRGAYPGLLRCDTLYHDLRHVLETGLTMARLLDADARAPASADGAGIDGEHALLGVLLALFHDVGLLRRGSEAQVWGATFTPIHEERGVEFLRQYLPQTTLASLSEKAGLIMPTKLIFRIPDDWSALDRKLASMIASADLLSQLADCCYLEKCWHFLFLEFTAFGIAGTPGSVYPDRETLMEKSSGFYSNVVITRLEQEFRGICHLMDTYSCGSNPYQEAIDCNFGFLEKIVATHDFSQLRRRPRPYVGDPPGSAEQAAL